MVMHRSNVFKVPTACQASASRHLGGGGYTQGLIRGSRQYPHIGDWINEVSGHLRTEREVLEEKATDRKSGEPS